MDIKSMSLNVNVKPVPVGFDTQEVVVTQAVSTRLARFYVESINNAFAKLSRDVEVDVSDVVRYFNYLVSLRIGYVNGQRYPREANRLKIPTVFALGLSHVGVVRDQSLGIELIPTLKDEIRDNAMTLDEAVEFSDKLFLAEYGGLKLVEGLPRDPAGQLETMYFTWIEDKCLAHTNAHGISNAALSAFFSMNHLGSLISPRVMYGYRSELETALRDVIVSV